MKNHELLDWIGDVNEDYVLAAGNNVVKPRFRWKALAACAACAALVAAAYPIYRASHPALHDYTVMEGGGTLDTQAGVKAPASGAGDPAVGGAYVGDDTGNEVMDGFHYNTPGQEAAVDEEAANQYGGLLRGLGGQNGGEPDTYPDWFAGAWIDHSEPNAPARLAVSIVDGFRTGELEAQIVEWCGGTGEIVFVDAKYSYSYLDRLMEPATHALDGTGLSCGIGVDVMANCLGVDLYGNGESIPDSVLAELAKLDPGGDAIRVRVFTGKLDTLTDEAKKGAEPVPGGARAEPSIETSPGAVQEADQPAVYDLPEKRADAPAGTDGEAQYDLLGGADGLPGNGLLY